MTLEHLITPVGRHAHDDRETIPIPGALITPNRRTDTGIIFICGITGKYPDYIPYFAQEIGNILPIYVTQ